MTRVVVRPAAAADIEDAYRWYESRQPGLGEELLTALASIHDRIVESPEAFPILHRNTRRALIPRRFPYGLFYRLDGETIINRRLHARETRSTSRAASYVMVSEPVGADAARSCPHFWRVERFASTEA